MDSNDLLSPGTSFSSTSHKKRRRNVAKKKRTFKTVNVFKAGGNFKVRTGSGQVCSFGMRSFRLFPGQSDSGGKG